MNVLPALLRSQNSPDDPLWSLALLPACRRSRVAELIDAAAGVNSSVCVHCGSEVSVKVCDPEPPQSCVWEIVIGVASALATPNRTERSAAREPFHF